MKFFLRQSLIAAGIVCLLVSGFERSEAGDLFGRLGHKSDCGCGPSLPQAPYAPAVVYQHHGHHADAAIDSGCLCSGAVSACCGVGGGVMQLGNIYGAGSIYGAGNMSVMHGGARGHGPSPGSFLSGYEGLPNMDGGGIHHRYPYHSYRRPWAHPGTPSTNVTIVW